MNLKIEGPWGPRKPAKKNWLSSIIPFLIEGYSLSALQYGGYMLIDPKLLEKPVKRGTNWPFDRSIDGR